MSIRRPALTTFAMLLVLAAAAPTDAEVVVHDNRDGAFPWWAGCFALFGGPADDLTLNTDVPSTPCAGAGAICDLTGSGGHLDLTLPPTQTGAPPDPLDPAAQHRLTYFTLTWTTEPGDLLLYRRHALGLGLNARMMFSHVVTVNDIGPIPEGFSVPRTLAPGDTVGPLADFQRRPYTLLWFSDVSQELPAWTIDTGRIVLGVEFDLPGGTHYGWLQMRPWYDETGCTVRFVAERWAYETTPGAAITVPDFCASDLDGSGSVNVVDLLELLGDWGHCGHCAGDIEIDGRVDVLDLLELLSTWGEC